MRQVIQDARKGVIKIIDVPVPAIRENCVLVRNCYSLISAGTEKLMLEFAKKSLLGKAKARPDLVKQVMQKVKRDGLRQTFQRTMTRLEMPAPIGYSCAGEIIEMGKGISGFGTGDKVACGGARYANHADFIIVPKNLVVKVPKILDLKEAAFVTVGSISLHSVRMANVGVNEYIGIIGMGLIGQIAMQIVKASGCKVFGFDINKTKVDFGLKRGLDYGTHKYSEASSIVKEITKGRGLDSVIITASTSSNEPITLAGELSRDRGKVIAVGAIRMDIPRRIYYDKEIDFRVSRSYGPGRYDTVYEEKGIDYPIGYVRWTENRNMEAILELIAEKKIDMRDLISFTFDIEDAQKAYSLIKQSKSDYYGILLEFKKEKPERKIVFHKETVAKEGVTKVGIIGAGNFARDFIIPNLKKLNNVEIVGIATAKGVSARYVADKYGAQYITTDSQEIINDMSINCVFILTRHNLHTPLAIDALKAGKNVFVEKPLSINREELISLIKIWKKSKAKIMVGYNRRFSPYINQIKSHLIAKAPSNIIYRINAGVVPKNSWIHDITEGGGRIIGEVCHFIDLLMYLTESKPLRVYSKSAISYDNISTIIEFENGSICSIIYTPLGNSSFSKERIEIFSAGKVAVLDDFRHYSIISGGKEIFHKRGPVKKGYYEEISEFFKSIKKNEKSPIKFKDLVIGTLTTMKICDSVSNGLPEEIDIEKYC